MKLEHAIGMILCVGFLMIAFALVATMQDPGPKNGEAKARAVREALSALPVPPDPETPGTGAILKDGELIVKGGGTTTIDKWFVEANPKEEPKTDSEPFILNRTSVGVIRWTEGMAVNPPRCATVFTDDSGRIKSVRLEDYGESATYEEIEEIVKAKVAKQKGTK